MFNKLKLLYLYISILRKNRDYFKREHGISIDWVYRLFTTYTIPVEEVDNIKTLGSTYVNDLLKKEINKIDKVFLPLGLSELVGIMEVIELNQRQIGISFRYKYINTAKLFSNIIWLIFTFFFCIFGFFVANYFGLFIGLFIIFIIYLMSKLFI